MDPDVAPDPTPDGPPRGDAGGNGGRHGGKHGDPDGPGGGRVDGRSAHRAPPAIVLGPRFFDGTDIVEGTVRVDPSTGLVLAVEEGTDTPPGALDVHGLVVPAPVNAHTHLGDRLARAQVRPRLDRGELTLAEAVAPPDGLKHRILAEMSEEDLLASLGDALAEAARVGTARVLDFREGGPWGAAAARRAWDAAGDGHTTGPARLDVLGRPSSPDHWDDEVHELAGLVDGLGISGLADQPYELTERQAAWCRAHDVPLAIHFSETRREAVTDLVALEPDLVVHATQVNAADIDALADAGVAVAACPRSNALFGNRPPLAALHEAGITLGLGTDNAMFHAVDVWAEAALVLGRDQGRDQRGDRGRHGGGHGTQGLKPVDVLRWLCCFRLPGEREPRLARGAGPAVVLDDRLGLAKALADGARVAAPANGWDTTTW